MQPTRLFRPWDFPGKSTGVGCHFGLLGSGQLPWQTALHIVAGELSTSWGPLWERTLETDTSTMCFFPLLIFFFFCLFNRINNSHEFNNMLSPFSLPGEPRDLGIVLECLRNMFLPPTRVYNLYNILFTWDFSN